VPDRTVAGATIHYETAGDGFPLVLLHGIGSNSRSWRRQLAAISSDFKVIAWDAPGYGRSSDPAGRPSMSYYASCLGSLLDGMRFDRIHLLGHSTGGVIAQEFYRAYPERVSKLILADTRYMGSQETLEQRLKMIRTMTPVQLAAARAPKLLSRSAPADLVRETASIMSEVRALGYEFAAIALAECDTRDILRNLRVPTLLIWGAEDEITPLWNEIPPNARLEVIPNAGHLCYAEQPDIFNGIVRDFLSPLPGAEGDLFI
jgi:pimeloyl-ACP methyl ester carboxylesterase